MAPSATRNYHHQNIKKHWNCHQCGKRLSSKRSYDEHMNIHNKSRPFACDECEYAAASQMTLRRHKLRNHIPRTNWGYHCPHCDEKYMEPASYQQHVMHWGCSATFGCPYRDCTFTTKSSRYFCDHLAKHKAVMSSKSSSNANVNFDNTALYLINDEFGYGHSNGKTLRRFNPQNTWRAQANIQKVIYREMAAREEEEQEVSRINVEELLDEQQERSARRRTKFRPAEGFEMCRKSSPNQPKINVLQYPILQKQEDYMTGLHEIGWIETEVVIDEEINKLSQLPDGQIDDFGLD